MIGTLPWPPIDRAREVRTGMEMMMAFCNGCITTIYRRSRCCKHQNFGGVLVAVY